MTESTCTGCGKPVRWVITEGGRRMPLDPDPVPEGNVVPVMVDGHRRARVLTGDELPYEGEAWQTHFRSCRAAPEFRKRQARLAPRCRVCSGVMDADLARLEQWTTHPACDPTDGANTVRAALAATTAAAPDRQLEIPEAS